MKKKKATCNQRIIVCDFETTTDEDDCRVWAVGCYDIVSNEFWYYNNIDDFMTMCATIYYNDKLYFHNEKFDGDFIMNWLFRHGYSWVDDRKKLDSKTFTTTISDKGQFYCMEICFYKDNAYTNKVTIYDSLKILPMSVHDMAKAFGLEEKKGEINYKDYREVGHKLTEEEVEYLKNDVVIVGKSLVKMFEQGLKKMTIGGNAINDYKKRIGKDNFSEWFPLLDEETDYFCRQSYKGGFVWANPLHKNKMIGEGDVYDVNSLFPSRMHSSSGCRFPYGVPQFFKGKYKPHKLYDLYIQRVVIQFELKPNHVPCIQIKKNFLFSPTEYLTSSNGEDVELVLTQVDLELIFEQYNVTYIEYIDGYMFKSDIGMFDSYINHWMEMKEEATRTGNKGLRSIAKLLLNNLYGKFGTNPKLQSKIPVYLGGKVGFILSDITYRDPVYTPVATFVTAYARAYTIRSAQKVGLDHLLYCDTDSIHCKEVADVSSLEIHDTKLGAWAHESHFEKAKFLRSKCYLEQIDGKLCPTVAGMPDSCYENVTFDNFCLGSEFSGKLRMKRVEGGIVLVDTPFTIKL